VPDERRAAVAARLADDIMKNRGGHAYVGVLGARWVLPVLTATGHHDVAYTVATQTTEPSWGYWTDLLKIHRPRRRVAGQHTLAQPSFLRRNRAMVL